MNSIFKATILVLMASGSASWGGQVAWGQTTEVHKLQLKPAAIPEYGTVPLLPKPNEQIDGNAAVVMLRLIWEQQPFMTKMVPRIPEFLELEVDDPKLSEFPFDGFKRRLARAASMRTADWNYELDSDRPFEILLPDVQGLRTFVERGMTIWIKQRLSAGDVLGALHGVQVQLGCSRHIAETPIHVCRLSASSIANQALENLLLVLEHEECPNLYWALALVEDELIDLREAFAFNAGLLEQSLPALKGDFRYRGDPQWKQVATQFADVMEIEGASVSELEAPLLMKRLKNTATRFLKERQKFTDDDFQKMSSEEVVMRWILSQNRQFQYAAECALSLPSEKTILALYEIEQDIDAIQNEVKAPASPFFLPSSTNYLFALRFEQTKKLLQVIEAIRDHVAKHDGNIPASLSEISLHLPNDPVTNTAFIYKVAGRTVTLQTNTIEGFPKEKQFVRKLEVTIPAGK